MLDKAPEYQRDEETGEAFCILNGQRYIFPGEYGSHESRWCYEDCMSIFRCQRKISDDAMKAIERCEDEYQDNDLRADLRRVTGRDEVPCRKLRRTSFWRVSRWESIINSVACHFCGKTGAEEQSIKQFNPLHVDTRPGYFGGFMDYHKPGTTGCVCGGCMKRARQFRADEEEREWRAREKRRDGIKKCKELVSQAKQLLKEKRSGRSAKHVN